MSKPPVFYSLFSLSLLMFFKYMYRELEQTGDIKKECCWDPNSRNLTLSFLRPLFFGTELYFPWFLSLVENTKEEKGRHPGKSGRRNERYFRCFFPVTKELNKLRYIAILWYCFVCLCAVLPLHFYILFMKCMPETQKWKIKFST